MAVNTQNASRYIRQAVETWSSVQNHDLGFEFIDRSTGKKYRYVKLAAAVTSTGVVSDGTPLGAYIANANATHTLNNVSADASLAQSVPTGVARGLATATNCYGFMEVIDQSLETTVNVTWDAIIAGSLLNWDGDGYLNSVDPATLNTTGIAASIVAIAVDSHRISYSRNSVLLTTAQSVTPVFVRWL